MTIGEKCGLPCNYVEGCGLPCSLLKNHGTTRLQTHICQRHFDETSRRAPIQTGFLIVYIVFVVICLLGEMGKTERSCLLCGQPLGPRTRQGYHAPCYDYVYHKDL